MENPIAPRKTIDGVEFKLMAWHGRLVWMDVATGKKIVEVEPDEDVQSYQWVDNDSKVEP
jgi:hypothetical protein